MAGALTGDDVQQLAEGGALVARDRERQRQRGVERGADGEVKIVPWEKGGSADGEDSGAGRRGTSARARFGAWSSGGGRRGRTERNLAGDGREEDGERVCASRHGERAARPGRVARDQAGQRHGDPERAGRALARRAPHARRQRYDAHRARAHAAARRVGRRCCASSVARRSSRLAVKHRGSLLRRPAALVNRVRCVLECRCTIDCVGLQPQKIYPPFDEKYEKPTLLQVNCCPGAVLTAILRCRSAPNDYSSNRVTVGLRSPTEPLTGVAPIGTVERALLRENNK